MTKCVRRDLSPLWAGLLIISSLAPSFAGGTEQSDAPIVRFNDGFISVTAENVPATDLIRAIADAARLRLVEHVVHDQLITVEFDRKRLPEALAEILGEASYQLYQGVNDTSSGELAIPGTLWIFAHGSSRAPASTVFFEAVLYRGNIREKKEAIRELRRLATPAAVQALSLALGDDNAAVRAATLEALEHIGSEDALAAIASNAMDSDPWVRAEAVNALASGDSRSATQYLALAINDPDPRVRMAVLESMADVPFGSVPNAQAIRTLNNALTDENPDVRMQAMESLEEIGGDIAFEALMRARLDQDRRVADEAEAALSADGDP